jgi:hypothetical protein
MAVEEHKKNEEATIKGLIGLTIVNGVKPTLRY